MAWISSITSTVLPTPAPPNIAALPPWASGASRSITLMPVSNTAVVEVSSSSVGGGLWMPRLGVSPGSAGPRSRTAPTTSSSRPRTASPTGTEMGAPVARTLVPRARPAVACSATPRTVAGSTWLCTSSSSGSGRSHCTTSAVLIGGRAPPSKPTSTTAPRTDITLPFEITCAMKMSGRNARREFVIRKDSIWPEAFLRLTLIKRRIGRAASRTRV